LRTYAPIGTPPTPWNSVSRPSVPSGSFSQPSSVLGWAEGCAAAVAVRIKKQIAGYLIFCSGKEDSLSHRDGTDLPAELTAVVSLPWSSSARTTDRPPGRKPKHNKSR